VVITETPREGWAVATESGESVALDLHIDDGLRRAGIAREIVRTLQEGRKNAGLQVSDRIAVWWSSNDDDMRAALSAHLAMIAGEVLALDVVEAPGPAGAVPIETDLPIALAIARVETA
jgi:isoleucyl-tRNA synthetase